MRILFICKDRHQSGGQLCSGRFGLWNSANLLRESLFREVPGVFCNLISVIDANCIDRAVTKAKADIVVIEALWVTPEKLKELQKLHPRVKWIVRVHSKASFLAQEGIAIEWMNGYRDIPQVFNSVNNIEFAQDLKKIGYGILYLPNVYNPPHRPKPPCSKRDDEVHIGCFGALRPLKNHLGQAVAAIHFADRIGKHLQFHINANTDESSNGVLRNLRSLFKASPTHDLIEHDWLPHDHFRDLVATMDIGMQVSLSESFNIVTADFVHAGIPVVVSNEVKFAHWLFQTPNSTPAMVRTLLLAYYLPIPGLNSRLLDAHNAEAIELWKSALSA